MVKQFDRSQFIGKFRAEANDHLAKLEKDLLYVEKNPKNELLIADMMREAHTLKGAATMMGFKRIAEVTHKFEDALLQIKKGLVKPEGLHFELLFKVLDSMKPLLEDKLTWPDKGVAYPYVIELEKKINETFGIMTAKTTKDLQRPQEEIAAAEPQIAQILTKSAQADGPSMQSVVTESAESIRVDVAKLNKLMNLVGELVIGKIRIDQRKIDLDSLLSKVEEINSMLYLNRQEEAVIELSKELKKDFYNTMGEFDRTAEEISFVTSQLQDSAMSIRMVPLEMIFGTFPRMVRDLAKMEKKLIGFNITGEETELDKTVIEKIQDPLMHILRNAVSHGIELPAERKKLGKPEEGKINLRAYYKGSQVIIEVEDDGSGIDAKKVKNAAVKRGILTIEASKEISDSQVLYLLFTPGFSTETDVSQISGRGIGLDVVKTNVTQLKGIIDINSKFGEGTKFTIKLPLTLAIAMALFVKAGNETLSIPLDNIEEIVRIRPDEIKKAERREAISVRDEVIPLVRLGKVLGLEKPEETVEKQYLPVIIVGAVERKLAIVVDELVGKLEIVAKNLGDHLKKVPYIAGATILGNGDVVLMLDVPSIVLDASNLPGLVSSHADIEKGHKKEVRRSVLVVEDSLITRDIEKSILEAAGYKAGTVKDGEEALKILAETKFDLVLTDIAMSGMDGIELISRMKKDENLSKIPVVVVSAKGSEEDKKRGLQAGADAYLVKSEFDQTNLLDTIERLIG